MKTIYIECKTGAAGDMLTGALCETYGKRDEFIKEINSCGIPKVEITAADDEKCGIKGTHITVKVDGHEEHHHHGEHHHHSTLSDIVSIISGLDLPQEVKDDACAVYKIIADAESKAHNTEVDLVHFHEVGAMDAVADVVGACLLMNKIKPQKVIVSPINTGSGTVHTAHGILPVPAPATAYILRGIPMYSSDIQKELCTPTGAAILKYYADEFSDMPVITAKKCGIGTGNMNLEQANIVRIFECETNETIAELSCNIDDMTGEAVAYACEVLEKSGASDVFTTPVYMKKGRPGIMLTCLCKVNEAYKFARLILKHTSTIGVRKAIKERYVLDREIITKDGIRIKKSKGFDIEKSKPEFEDIKKIADEKGLTISEVLSEI